MKSGKKAFCNWIVFFVAAIIFSFIWWKVPDLANAHVTAVRFAFYRMILVATGCSLVVAVLVRRSFRFHFLDWAVLVYVGYIWTRFLMGGMVEYRVQLALLLGVLYFVFRLLNTLGRHADRIMLSVFMLAVVAEAAYGFCQLYGGASSRHALFRLTGSFFNPGPYSCFLAVGLTVAFSRVMNYRRKIRLDRWPRNWRYAVLQADLVLAWTCLLGTLILLPATLSRSAWMAALAGCGGVAWQQGCLRPVVAWLSRCRKKAAIVIAMASVLLLLFFAGIYAVKKDSADGRLLIWKVSLQAMKERPWTGVGMGHFGGAYGQAQGEWFASGAATPQEENVAGVPEYGFNEYLQTGVELGGIGLALFVLVLAVAAIRLFSIRDKEGIAGGLVVWLVFAWFSYPLSVLPLAVTLVLLLALSAPGPALRPVALPWVSLPLAALCLLLAVANVPRGPEKRDAYVEWADEQTYFNMKIYEGTVDNYARLYPLLREEPRFLFEYGQCLAKTGRYDESSRILLEAASMHADPMFYNILGKNEQAMKRYPQAEAYFRQAARILPNRLYPLYLLASFYLDTGQEEKGRETALQLLRKEPKVMSDAVLEMKEELRGRLGINLNKEGDE